MKVINDFLVSQDVFGYVIHLNLNREGNTHRTNFGGFVSLILKVSMFLFIFQRFQTLLTEGSGDNNSSEGMLLGDDKREIPFKYVDTAFMVTPGLRLFNKTLNYMEDENVRKHIELTYIQMF